MPAIYTVVTIDGQEHSNLDLETVKRWFFERKLREDSFVMSSETGQWKVLKKEFDLNQWTSYTQQQSQWQQQSQMPPQQPQWNNQPMPLQQPIMQPPPQQQWDATQQWNSQQQTEQWNSQQHQQPYSQPMPEQNWNAPQQQEVNAHWILQQPQQAWVSQNNWVAPPPPSSSSPVFFGAFESGSSRAKWAAISMKIVLVFTALSVIINVLTVLSPPDVQGMEQGQIDSSMVGLLVIAGLVGLGFFVAFIVAIILYLMWLHRAYKNLQALGQQTDYSPGWAVGWWFIPFANLVMPYKIVNELYEKSDFQGNNSSSIVTVWWLTYILSGIIGWLANKITFGSKASEAIATAAMVDIVSGILSIIAGWACISIINTVNETQEERVGGSQSNYTAQSPMGYQTNYYR